MEILVFVWMFAGNMQKISGVVLYPNHDACLIAQGYAMADASIMDQPGAVSRWNYCRPVFDSASGKMLPEATVPAAPAPAAQTPEGRKST
jgi:hypothetical protein